jgi:hypothetical protein
MEGGACLGEVGHQGYAQERYTLLSDPPITLSALGYYEVSGFYHILLPSYSALLQAQSNGSTCPWPENSETMSFHQVVLLRYLSQQQRV